MPICCGMPSTQVALGGDSSSPLMPTSRSRSRYHCRHQGAPDSLKSWSQVPDCSEATGRPEHCQCEELDRFPVQRYAALAGDSGAAGKSLHERADPALLLEQVPHAKPHQCVNAIDPVSCNSLLNSDVGTCSQHIIPHLAMHSFSCTLTTRDRTCPGSPLNPQITSLNVCTSDFCCLEGV